MRRLLLAVVVCLVPVLAPLVAAEAETPGAAEVIEKVGARRGICVVLGDKDGKLAVDLARRGELTVFVQLPDAAAVAAARRAADAAGFYGKRIFDRRLVSPLPRPGQQSAVHRSPRPGAVPDAVHRRAALRAVPAGLRRLRRARLHGLRPRRLARARGALVEHPRRPERLQRRGPVEAGAAGGHHGRSRHHRRHAHDALPGRPRVLQAHGRRNGQGHRTDRPAGGAYRRDLLEMDRPVRRRAVRAGRQARPDGPDHALAEAPPRLALGRHLQGLQRAGVPLGLRPDAAGHRSENQEGPLALPDRPADRQPGPLHEQRANLPLLVRQLPGVPGRQERQGDLAEGRRRGGRAVQEGRALQQGPRLPDRLEEHHLPAVLGQGAVLLGSSGPQPDGTR